MVEVAAKRESIDAASASGSQPVVSARILKKRETDRKCQRMIRERTKSRIAYLEGLVEQFRDQDSSGRLETMMKQLSEMKEERDALIKKVKSIESIISDGKLKEEADPSETSVFVARSDSEDENPASVNSRGTILDSPSPRTGVSVSTSQDLSAYVLHNKQYASYLQNPGAAHWATNPVHTLPHQHCECLSQPDMMNPSTGLNKWRFANEVLTEWFKWAPETLDMRHYAAFNDDVPVRAVVEGWDAVEQQGHMHPIWRLLRSIDETIFGSLEQRERLGTLQLMGWLILSHINPTREQHMKLPPFYLKRPTQNMLNAYATEYFAWPGLRERFVYSEHRYCSSMFWRLYCQNVRIRWPYEFRDCYTLNVDTGLYSISPTFHERIRDVRAWTMGLDMFKQYPELYSDIPAWNHVPSSLTPASPFGRGRKALPPTTKVSQSSSKGKAPDRRNSSVSSATVVPVMHTPSPTDQQLTQASQVYNVYHASGDTSCDVSTMPMSTSFDYSVSIPTTTAMNMQTAMSMHVWNYNNGGSVFQTNTG